MMGQKTFASVSALAAWCAALCVIAASPFSALGQQSQRAPYRGVTINMVPHVRAKPDFEGEACAAMMLKRMGTRLDQDFVFDQSGVDPALGRGCNVAELKLALERIGFVVGQVWYALSPDAPRDDLQSQFSALHADLTAGVPSIVHMRQDENSDAQRFRLLLGYDDDRDEVIYHEPAEENGAFRRMPREKLLDLWPIRQGDTLIVARMPLRAEDDLNFVGPSEEISDADYAQHVRVLREGLPKEFHVFVQKPFVIIGNEMEGTVRKHARETVKWAVDRLKLLYFEKNPDHIINVWLFKDQKTYNFYIQKYYKHKPLSRFGYYSPKQKALFVNMKYGNGTLVHEIVHPLMAANFPKCPSWFNEGMASLYEQANDRDGVIRAQTNQRLKQVQKAIMAKQFPPLETLTATSREEFYSGDHRILYYAQARYLCYYLEKHDLLGKFYHEFRANSEDDPTGYKTLQSVLGEDGKDMGRFQHKWEYWLLMRRY